MGKVCTTSQEKKHNSEQSIIPGAIGAETEKVTVPPGMKLIKGKLEKDKGYYCGCA